MNTKEPGRRRFLKDVHCWRVWPWEQYGPRAGRQPANNPPEPHPAPSRRTQEHNPGTSGRSCHRPYQRLRRALPVRDLERVRKGTGGPGYSASGFDRDHHAVRAPFREYPRLRSPRTSIPGEHRLLIHGMVDRPLIFTMEELKRLPSVSRIHFLECAGNSSPALAQSRRRCEQRRSRKRTG